jgi:hypothetical protein
LIVAAIFVAAVVWGFAHFASAPGTQVKVLWGLVEYTKVLGLKDRPPAAARVRPTQTAKVATETSSSPVPADTRPSVLGSVELEVLHGQSSDGFGASIEALRSGHDLRELISIESDRPIGVSPAGTYFFVSGYGLDQDAGDPPARGMLKQRANRRNISAHIGFEVHHRVAGQIVLIGFVSESDGDRIRTLPGSRDFKVTIAESVWGPFTTLVVMPIERIVKSRNRELDVADSDKRVVIDVTIR